jgi:tripartite-type tricarboxylate transporter receptor subunit TctC
MVAQSVPDGYTLLCNSSQFPVAFSLYKNPGYDPFKDFAPIVNAGVSPNMLFVHPSVPANTLQELVAYAKLRPGQLNYASVGSGGMTHLATESFSTLAGVKMLQVPYKGTGPAFTDLVGGQVHLFFSPPTDALVPYIKAGKLKAIAVSGESRKVALPQVPTLTEGGLPGFDIKVWYGILAPLNVPRRIIDKISAEVPKILASADMKERLVNQELDLFISTPEQFASLIRDDTARFARIIKEGNIKLEN